MRYVIIGAGAIGGAIGGRLAEAGHDVVLVARGRHLETIRSAGLLLATPSGETVVRVPAIGGPDEIDLRADDVLFTCVKVQDAGAVVDDWGWRPVAGGGTAAELLPLFCAHNGLEGERIALRQFQRVYGVCVYLPSSFTEPGVIVTSSDPTTGVLTLGRYPAGSDALCRAVSADLQASGFGAPVTDEVMAWKNAKLIMNIPNALEAVIGTLTTEGAKDLRARAVAEGVAVMDAAGLPRPTPDEEAAARSALTVGDIPGRPRPGSSSVQSLLRGTGSVETDYLAGEIVLLGRLHGVATPANAVLQRESARLLREGLAPGSVTAPELAVMIDRATTDRAAVDRAAADQSATAAGTR